MPIVKQITVTENAIGVAYIDTLTLPILPNMFTIIGASAPIISNIACFEKKPEFLMEYLSNFTKDIIKSKIDTKTTINLYFFIKLLII